MAKQKILSLLLGFLMLILWLPWLQQQLGVVDSGKLHGVVVQDTVLYPLNAANWFNGTFQESRDRYVQNNAGFRADFIRLNNQIHYSLFRKTNAHVSIGRNGNLFEQEYIDAYLGRDFIGTARIRERVRKMKFVQDTLDKLGKRFVLIYAPSKARYAPEDFPAADRKVKPGLTNYAVYKQIGDSAGLRQIDFNSWFGTLKNKSRHLVFARSSIHWTEYGALLAIDSLQRFMKAQGSPVPDFVWDEQKPGITTDPRFSEDDMQRLLNIFLPVAPEERFFHPEIGVRPPDMPGRTKAVYIGDSFFWMWHDLLLPHRLHSTFQFWSYYHEVFSPGKPMRHIADIDPIREMLEADWIVIMYTECNFANLGSHFPEDAYAYFTGIRK